MGRPVISDGSTGKARGPEGGIASDAFDSRSGHGRSGRRARARELGAEPLVLEKGDRPGGSMLLSSCVIWRYHSLEAFQEECPDGDPALQRVIVEQLDEAIEWLESLGAPVVEHETGNPRTVGKRFDPAGLTQTLVRVIGDDSVRLSERGQTPLQKANILSTGGFPVRLARERGLAAARESVERGGRARLRARARRGRPPATSTSSTGARCLPAVQVAEQDFVRLSQLYGRFAEVTSEDGRERFEGDPGWSETELVQAIARWPGGRAWYRVARGRARASASASERSAR